MVCQPFRREKMIPPLFLKTIELFNGLTDEELNEVSICCEEVKLEKETNVFLENERAEYLFALIEGSVSLRYKLPSDRESKDNRVASMIPGNAFGWSSLREDATYTLSAYCTNANCVALKVHNKKLNAIMDANHTIGYKVMRNLSKLIGQRFTSLQEEVVRRDGQNEMDGW
jgi:CRP/FNR family transcriptional regulator, cyclic AMP receptor protein